MNNEDIALDHLEQGRFMEAVSVWRDFAAEGGYLDGSSDTSWGLPARLLEARLIYLSMLKQDEVFQAFVDRYRTWLLDQTAQIATSTELSLERFALPDSMRVGHPEIDRDHEVLFAYANDIRDALRQDDRVQATKLADGLIDEIVDHFKREEKVLIEVGYPDADTHAQYHGVLLSKAEEVRKVLFGLLSGWLSVRRHLRHADFVPGQRSSRGRLGLQGVLQGQGGRARSSNGKLCAFAIHTTVSDPFHVMQDL